jgi:lysophospholipase L1-like esterase
LAVLQLRRTARILAPLTAVLAVAALLPTAGSAAVPLPSSMASTGDSITQAYNTGGLFTENPAASWSTGTTAAVNSQYLRIKARNSAINGHAFNDSKTGAVMANLDAQLATAAGQHVGYVTILVGANDACTSSVATMTSVATFRSQFATALQRFSAASPGTRIFVASIPNVSTLWSLLKGNGSARLVWAVGKICQSMLGNPTSTAAADVSRRAQVVQRVVDFNTQLAQVCAGYSLCRFDGNAVFNTAFTTTDVNTRDYFHPSISGQAKLASVTWAAGFWAP